LFSIPPDGNNRPALAMKQPGSPSQWKVILDLRPAPQQVYAVLCKTDDSVESLRYISLARAQDIEAVLRILAGFGWKPVVYTELLPN
jgi:hypothetical protein